MKKLFILFCIFLVSLNSQSQDSKILIGFPLIPDSIKSNETSVYEEYLKLKVKKEGLLTKVKFHKSKDVIKSFNSKQLDCVFPAMKLFYKEFYPVSFDIVFSKKSFVLNQVFFALKDTPLPDSFQNLKGKKIALTSGFKSNGSIFEKLQNSGAKFLFIESRDERIKALKNKKADFFIDLDWEVKRNKIIKVLHFNKNFPLYKFKVNLLCKKSRKVEHFLEELY